MGALSACPLWVSSGSKRGRGLLSAVHLKADLSASEAASNGPAQRAPATSSPYTGEITEVTPSKPDRGTIGIKAETRNQRGDVVQSLTATLLVPRRV